MGQMSFVPILGTGLNVYLPIGFLVIAAFNTFDACTKIMLWCGIDVASDPDPNNPDHKDAVAEGNTAVHRIINTQTSYQ